MSKENQKPVLGFLLAFLIGAGLSFFVAKSFYNKEEKVITSEDKTEPTDLLAETRNRILGLVDTAVAHPNIRSHSKDGAYAKLSYYKKAKVKGILHDTTEFRDYVNVTFKKFTETHTIPDTLIWQIGIYPMISKSEFNGTDQPRIGFYFIPTLVKKTSKPLPTDIIDYMYAINDPVLKEYYKSDLRKANPERNILDDKYIYDEGQLWP